jgi:hypothetical protein
MRTTHWLALGAAAIAIAGCKEERVSADNTSASTTNVSPACVGDADALKALCPAGTALEAHGEVGTATACKDGAGSADGGIGSICRVDGKCSVTCKVVLECKCGAALFSTEEVRCIECSVCGNGTKEPGEECDQGDQNGTGNGCDKNCKAVAAACSPNGDMRCSPDLTTVQKCTDGVWYADTKCTADEQCDPATKLCKAAEGYCATVDERQCANDFAVQECGADHRWAITTCPEYAPLCVVVNGSPDCVASGSVAVSAHYRVSTHEIVVGGIYGYGTSNGYSVQLGPLKRHQ